MKHEDYELVQLLANRLSDPSTHVTCRREEFGKTRGHHRTHNPIAARRSRRKLNM